MTFGEAYKNLDSKCRSGRNETTPDAARYQAIKSVVLKSGVPEGLMVFPSQKHFVN